MLGWIKQVLSGNHDPDIPQNASVKRDGQGRIAEVSMTLGDEVPAEVHPDNPPSDRFQKELTAASKALVSTNTKLIQMGIGNEQNYEFSQDDGKLTFLFADGRKIIAEGEIIGSFDPAAKSFMWAWANPTISTDINSPSVQVRQLGLAKNEPVLLEPKQSLKFKKITELMAFVAQHGKLDGIYRAITNGHVSVFIGYRLKSFVDSKGHEVTAESFAGKVSPEHISRAQAHCDAYDSEMLIVDEGYHAQDDRGKMGVFLDRKTEIYARFWKRDDDYWKPCSLGSPSEHNVKDYRIKFSGPINNQAVLIGRADGVRPKTVYQVEFFDDTPKITDQLIDWGYGFIWPG